MSVSLKSMQYFCTALDRGSIAAAASELNVAASAIAAAMDRIEDHFGLALTIRKRARGVEATADGRVMAARFQALLDDYRSVLQDGAARSQSLTGELRIGYYAPVAPAFLPRILAPLLPPATTLTFYLDACDNAAAQDGLRRGDYDAILFIAGMAEPWLEAWPLIEAPPYCLLAADHPLAGRAALSLGDLAGERLVSLNRPVAAEYYRALFPQPPVPMAQCSSSEMVRSLVGAEGACAILNMLPLTDISYAGDALVAVPLLGGLPALTLSVGTRRGHQRRAVSEFVAACRAYFEDPGPLVCRSG